MDKYKNNREWVRIASKSRPGRFYYFNKSTGETQWSPLKEDEESGKKQKEPSPRLSMNKISKTPAQDRLKRLQHNLKIGQTKTYNSSTTRHASELKASASKVQGAQLKDEPPTCSTSKRILTFGEKVTKSVILPNEVVESIKASKPAALDSPSKISVSDSSNDNFPTSVSKESVTLETSTKMPQCSKEPITNNILENLQNIQDNNSKLNSFSSGIVRKIKEICKIPRNISKKLNVEKLFGKNEKISNLNNSTNFKATRKAKVRLHISGTCTQAIINEIRDEKNHFAENKTPTKNLTISTPKKLNISSYPRGSANSRLERLKHSLISQQHEQQQSCNTTNNKDTLNTITSPSPETKKSKVTSLKIGHGPSISTNSSYKSANDTGKDEIEAMDWQPIVNDDVIEKSKFEPTLIVEKSRKNSLQKINVEDNQTMGDIIDTVNENLLRLSAEKQKDAGTNNKKWRKHFYYFVVDTNVLLRDLTFIEDLSKMKLCDTEGSILFIPYSVLQELDKLKMRSGSQEGVKTLAVRAIKYLNSKFENNSSRLQAQTALDERHHLVDINSADDSIINCCLQAKEHVSNILLLTEDVNLRNKAICNNIIVSAKSDLIAKRYNSSDKP